MEIMEPMTAVIVIFVLLCLPSIHFYVMMKIETLNFYMDQSRVMIRTMASRQLAQLVDKHLTSNLIKLEKY